jgi:hypothetical protein
LPTKVEGDVQASHTLVVEPNISRFPDQALVFAALAGASEGWLYSVASKDPLMHLKLDKAAIRCAAFSGDSAKLIVGDTQSVLHVVDLRDNYKQRRLTTTGGAAVRSILWLADNQRFVVHDEEGKLSLASVDQGQLTTIGELRSPALLAGNAPLVIAAAGGGDEFEILTWQPPETMSRP